MTVLKTITRQEQIETPCGGRDIDADRFPTALLIALDQRATSSREQRTMFAKGLRVDLKPFR
jgi:hypothetical protein